MFFPLIISILTALIFFAAIPVGGAFWVRSGWRSFRSRVQSCSMLGNIKYGGFRDKGDGFLGDYKFIGTLQAIQGDDIIWISNRSISLPVHLKQVSVFTLPHSYLSTDRGGVLSLRHSLPDEVPRRINWNRVFTLPEGTKILVCGGLWREKGQLMLKQSESQKLMVLIYDGSEDSILPRCVWGGRQRNEYINNYTPWSLIIGALLLLLESYLFYHNPMASMMGRLAALMAFSPAAVLLPPGVLFFEFYRILWRRGRMYRAERDLLKLSVRFWPDAVSLEECEDVDTICGSRYGWRRYDTGREGLDANPHENLLNPSVISDKDILGLPCYGFGPLNEEGRFIHSNDLLAGIVLLPGDPFEMARRSAVLARRMELLSGISFGIGIGSNLVLLFLLFNTFLP